MTPENRSTVAFIGLGIMGGPMAANLVRAGYDVTGYNRSKAPVERLVAAGGRGAESIAEAVKEAEFIVTMLPDTPDVGQVVLDDAGVLQHARPGALLIDMSTIRPDMARTIAERGVQRGIRVLDAPVSGGVESAVEGTLSIMVGGANEDFAAARPVFEALGTTLVHVGPNGTGQIVKAANQLIVAGTIQLVAEAIIFLEANQVDTRAAVEVLSGGLAGSRVLDRKASSMLKREFKPGFRVRLHHKDLGIMLATAREAGVVVPLGAAVGQLMAALNAQGAGDLDHSALLSLVELLSGREAPSASASQSAASA
jgi:2-hydroxy-3-oxopropionate reductase